MSSARFSFSKRGKPSVGERKPPVLANAKVIAMMPLESTAGTSQAEGIITRAKMILNQLRAEFSVGNNILAWLPVKLKNGKTIIKTDNIPTVKDDIDTLIIVTNGGEQVIEGTSSKEELMGAQFIDTVAANLSDDLDLTNVSRIIFVSDYSYSPKYVSKLQTAFNTLKAGVEVDVCRSLSVTPPKEQIRQAAVSAALGFGR